MLGKAALESEWGQWGHKGTEQDFMVGLTSF